jgi:formylglycine-generating enzyme required for sulfatase activity
MLLKIGKYKVVKKLGAGGFGAVYLAEDEKLHVQVAIKVFQIKNEAEAQNATSASFDAIGVLKQRFIDEARILRKLSVNPYIVEVYDLDEMSDGTPYYVMPYLLHSLADELGKDAFSQGALEGLSKQQYPKRLPVVQAINYLKQLVEALSAVHQAGLIHRDIKPANVLLNSQGQVQLCDFGIAKSALSNDSQSGLAMGSRNYMSPEQKESAKHVQPSSDIYSLGVLAYRMLTGQLPVARFEDPLCYAPDIGAGLNALILTALSQNALQRPLDGTDFLNQLHKAIKLDEKNLLDNSAYSEDSATWQASGAEIKSELKPLQQEIERILFSYGEISPINFFHLQPLSAIAGLDDPTLQQFIEQLQRQHAAKLTPLLTWLALLKQTINDNQGELDPRSRASIISSGRALGKSQNFVEQGITRHLALYRAEQGTQHVNGSAAEGLSAKALNKSGRRQVQPLILISIAALLMLISGYFWWQNYQQTQSLPVPDSAQSTAEQKLLEQKELEQKQQEQQLVNASQNQTAQQTDKTVLVEPSELTVELYPFKVLVSLAEQAAEQTARENAEQFDGEVRINDQHTYQSGMSLPYGQHKISVSKPGYVSQVAVFTLDAQHNEFSFRLQKELPQAIHQLLSGLVKIPAGRFIMGLQGKEKEQKPAFSVNISTFTLMNTEVTFAMWQSCVDAGGCSHMPADEGWGQAERPVINVSWFDIIEQFIPWLNQTTEKTFRLPSEAEWEYAARAGSTERYSWGSQINCQNARYGFYTKQCGQQKSTNKVQSYQGNAFGLFDMHGNVYEWVQDCWNDNYYGAPKNGQARLTGDCQRSVLRGGSWLNDEKSLTLVARNRHDRNARLSFYGFRLVQANDQANDQTTPAKGGSAP